MLLYSNECLFLNFIPKTSETPTLQDLSFTVRPGELLAVIGPVGAGKVSHNALWQLTAMPHPILNSWGYALCHTVLNWVYLECVSQKGFHGASALQEGYTAKSSCSVCVVFFLVHQVTQFENACLDISVKQILDVTAIWDRTAKKMGLTFVRAGPVGNLEVVKALLESFKHFLRWLSLVTSLHRW